MNRAEATGKTRVLLLTPSFGAYGGIQAFVLAVADALASESDIEPKVCFKLVKGSRIGRDLTEEFDRAGVSYCFVRPRSLEMLRCIRWADVVHVQTPSPDSIIASRLLRRPVAVTVFNNRWQNSEGRARLQRLVLRLADRCWYISDFVGRSWNLNACQRGVEKLPVLSILPGTVVPPEERKGFIFVGRWVPNKGLPELIQAYASAAIDHSAHPLTLVGDGPLKDVITGRINDLGLTSVRILGFLPQEARAHCVASSRWLVAPPNTNEDLGLTPIEARAAGVPCIVTRDGGLPEAAGANALMCEPGDVGELQDRLEEAASMPLHRYAAMAKATRDELFDHLQPMSLYAAHYRELAGALPTFEVAG
jgi:glycosyltransferase involved in cell wall biosynthesis